MACLGRRRIQATGFSRYRSRCQAMARPRCGGCPPAAWSQGGRIRASRRLACRRRPQRPAWDNSCQVASRREVSRRAVSRRAASRSCPSPPWCPWTIRVVAALPLADRARSFKVPARQAGQVRSCRRRPSRPRRFRRHRRVRPPRGDNLFQGLRRSSAGPRVPSASPGKAATRAARRVFRWGMRCSRHMRRARRSANRWPVTPRRCGLRPCSRGSPGCPRTLRPGFFRDLPCRSTSCCTMRSGTPCVAVSGTRLSALVANRRSHRDPEAILNRKSRNREPQSRCGRQICRN